MDDGDRRHDAARRSRWRASAAAAVALLALLAGALPAGAVPAGDGGVPPSDDRTETRWVAPGDLTARFGGTPTTAATDGRTTRSLLGASCASPLPDPLPAGWAPQGMTPDRCPLRWDPCTVIDWYYDPRGAVLPESVVVAAVERVASLSGLPLRYRGTIASTAASWFALGPDVPGLGLLVEWNLIDRSGVIGSAEVVATTAGGGAGEILHAAVTLDPSEPLDGTEWRATLLHELAHVVGLDHVSDPSQLMYPSLNSLTDFAAGDRAGLRAVGSVQGCVVGGIRRSIMAPTEQPPPPPPPPPPAPPVQRPAVGGLDDVWVDGRTVRVRGWAFDPNHSPIATVFGRVAFGRGVEVGFALADQPRPDVAGLLGAPPATGFTGEVVLPPGEHTFCVGALDHDGRASTGGVTNLGCRQVVIK